MSRKYLEKNYLISVVIPTIFINQDLLWKCLLALKDQIFQKTIKQPRIEVIIVCNVTFKLSKKLIRIYKSRLNALDDSFTFDFKWIEMGFNAGFALATNQGIRKAKGEYIVTLNDDVIVHQNWLCELIITQRETKADMIASHILKYDNQEIDSNGFGFAWRGKAEALNDKLECSMTNDSDYWLHHPALLNCSHIDEPFGADAAAALYTKKLFDKVGLFSEDFFAYLEDVELALRARQTGMYAALANKATAYHHKHVTSSGMRGFKQKQDLINWWKITLGRFNYIIWLKFGINILIERMKNLKGFINATLIDHR